jgi:hypothetical protein
MSFALCVFKQKNVSRVEGALFVVACHYFNCALEAAEVLFFGCWMPIAKPALGDLEEDHLRGGDVF